MDYDIFLNLKRKKFKLFNKCKENILKRYVRNLIILLLIILFVCLILFKVIKIQDKILAIFYKKEYNEYVEKYAKEYGVDENLIYSIIKNESKYDANAVSSSEAKGLMQIMDNTVKDIVNGIEELEYNTINIFDPETNIHLGTNYISELLRKYNNVVPIAVAAYNAGIGNVDKWIENGTIKEDGSNIENIPFKETNIYVRKVLRDYKIFKEL